MTANENVLYGPFVNHVELRQDIVRRAGITLTRARLLCSAVGILTILVSVLQIGELVAPAPWSDWSGRHAVAMTLIVGGGWLLAAVNVWSCRQRLGDSRANLLAYVSRLPIG